MENNNNLKLPVELLFSIAEYSDIYISAKLFISSEAMKNISQNYLLKRSDHPFHFLKQNANKIIQASISGIENYLKYDKKHPGYPVSSIFLVGADLAYDKGFHRAICFSDVLKASYKKNLIFKFFTVYVLLSEKNGEKLKDSVISKIVSLYKENNLNITNNHFLSILRNYLIVSYQIDNVTLSSIVEKYLKLIHCKFNDHSEHFYSVGGWEEDLYNLVDSKGKCFEKRSTGCCIS